ncbi:hypothetical protein PCE1_002108 [Barthelona sp. PCE]
MGRHRRTRKYAQTQKFINPNDQRLKPQDTNQRQKSVTTTVQGKKLRRVEENLSHFFFDHNEALVPPYHVLVDTNFINFSIRNHLTIDQAMIDCLHAKAIPCITDCVIAELEKLGRKYRQALRIAKSDMFKRLKCDHRGTYADDCICNRVDLTPVYIVATCDRDLQRRLRKIRGVPIMYIKGHRCAVERLPEAYSAVR